MRPVPLLFLGDSPDLRTGLARIGRDLACLASRLPQFRTGYLGRGGHGSSHFPFAQFNFPEAHQWGEGHIETVWQDFAGDQKGVILTIWDASRLGWFGNPAGIGGTLGEFLARGFFQRWGYFAVDSSGVGGRLTAMSADTIRGYDRVLAYGIYGAEVIGHTLGRPVEWIPHGILTEVFTPRDRAAARMAMGARADATVIGCVMTNQARKDWGLAFATIARLRNLYPKLLFWAHADVISRHWDLRALAADFGLASSTIVTCTGSMSDTDLSYFYSACDVTILPSLGEGFGYPIAESMACGVPVVHGRYGGGAELIPDPEWLVAPAAERLDTPHNVIRPVYSPVDWVPAVQKALGADRESAKETCLRAVEHLDWKLLWPGAWEKWMLAGLK